MTETARKTYLALLLSAFILIFFFFSHFLLNEFFKFNYQVYCFEQIHQTRAYWPFWNNALAPAVNIAFFVLLIALSVFGIVEAVRNIKNAEIKSLVFLSITALLIFAVLIANQLRLYLFFECSG